MTHYDGVIMQLRPGAISPINESCSPLLFSPEHWTPDLLENTLAGQWPAPSASPMRNRHAKSKLTSSLAQLGWKQAQYSAANATRTEDGFIVTGMLCAERERMSKGVGDRGTTNNAIWIQGYPQ